jgi:apolipoprotein N-acyltransferase
LTRSSSLGFLFAAALCGAVLVLAFPPFGVWPLGFLAPAGLCWLLCRPEADGRRGALAGFWFGMAFFSGTVYWVVPVMQRYGGLHPSMALCVLFLMVAVLSLFLATFGALVGGVARRAGALQALLLAPALWVAVELARNHLLTGFPWVRLGASLQRLPPLLQAASLAGVYGLSFLMLTVAAALALLARGRRIAGSVYLVAALTMCVAASVWGMGRISRLRAESQDAPGVVVASVQGNVPQDRKWSPDAAAAILKRHLDLTRLAVEQGAGLVVWPESSLPFPLRGNREFATRVHTMMAETDAALVLGSLDWRRGEGGEPEVFNSAFLLLPGRTARLAYDKHHLVPFGEYVPLRRLLFFASSLVEQVGELSRGSGEQHLATSPATGVPRIGILVCYEIIFPELSRRAVDSGAEILLTLTNDAWFGRTAAPYQHFSEAVLRAVETGRWVVRAANTGISGIISPTGEVLAETELNVEALAAGTVHPRDERTLYVRSGDSFAWACVILAAVVTVLGWRGTVRRSNPAQDQPAR